MKPKRIGQENLEFLNYGSHGETQAQRTPKYIENSFHCFAI